MKITLTYSLPDIDKMEIQFPCPNCKLNTSITLGQVRREEYFICRGCHATVRAIDHMGGVQQLKRKMNNLLR